MADGGVVCGEAVAGLVVSVADRAVAADILGGEAVEGVVGVALA